MKLVSRASLAGAATCVQHQRLVSSQSIGGGVGGEGVASWINRTRSCPPKDQLEVKARKTDPPPSVSRRSAKNKVHQNKKGRPGGSLDTMAKSPESAGGHRSFSLISPRNSLPLRRFSSAKRAPENFHPALRLRA